jgi:hypothetical protein
MSEAVQASVDVPEWLIDHYALVDAGDVDRYAADFGPDIIIRFGAQPEVRGLDAVRAALAAGHRRHTMEHTFVNVWETDGTAIIEFEVRYTFPDGAVEIVPSLAVIDHVQQVIHSLRVFIDRVPLDR